MHSLLQDLRFGARLLSRSPGFTSVAVIALALGIGANTAIFSVVNATLLQSLPFAQPEQIVAIIDYNRRTGGENAVSRPNFEDWRQDNRSLAAMAIYRVQNLTLADEGTAIAVGATESTAELFGVLGVQPLLGRALVPEDDKNGAQPVVVLDHRLWQRRFAGNPQVVGSQIKLDGRSFTVVGVMPAGFRFPVNAESELLISFTADPTTMEMMSERGTRMFDAVGRLRQGVTLAQASAEMDALAKRLEALYEVNDSSGVRLLPLRERIVGSSRRTLLVLFAAVAFVLLIACANVAILLLARATTRQREVAIRLALGATRGRLVRQFLTESLLLACMGGTVGVLLALWGADWLASTVLVDVPRMADVRVDGTVLGITAVLAIGTGLLFGLAPALSLSQPRLHSALKEGSARTTGGSRHHRVQGFLVMTQVAMALVLLAGAALMLESALRLQAVDPGFAADRLATVMLSLPGSRYSAEQRTSLLTRIAARSESLPGVEKAGFAFPSPFSHSGLSFGFDVEGAPPFRAGEQPVASAYAVSTEYFAAMGIPLLAGRTFTAADARTDAPPLVLVNETMARRFWPEGRAVGKRISFAGQGFFEIIGVVGDTKHGSLAEPAPLQLYGPFQGSWPFASLVLRAASAPEPLLGLLRRTVSEIDPELPVEPQLMRDQVADANRAGRSVMLLLGIFAGLGLLLSAVGIYGVMAYAVTERTHEIGIRAALGCQRSAILSLILGKGLRLAAAGIGAGLVASWAATRLLTGLLYGVSATHPPTFVVIALVLAAVALLASYVPASRATKVDPATALHAE